MRVSAPCASFAVAVTNGWSVEHCTGAVPCPRFGHILVLLPRDCAAAPEDAPKPRRGYFRVPPVGFGGPFAAPTLRRLVKDGEVYDPTPEQESELELHSRYIRIVVIGGIQAPTAGPGAAGRGVAVAASNRGVGKSSKYVVVSVCTVVKCVNTRKSLWFVVSSQ